MNLKYTLISIMILLCVILNACSFNPQSSTSDSQASTSHSTIPTQSKSPTESNAPLEIQTVLEFYIGCMELMKTDFEYVIRNHCHYELEEHFQLALENLDTFHSFQILRVEQLSEDLWVIEYFYTSEVVSGGAYDLNYLAKFDGEWKIMMSIKQIPDALKAGIEFEDYNKESPGILDPDDVLH